MEVTGLSRESVARVSKGEHTPPQGLVDSLKIAESARLSVITSRALDHLTDDKLAVSSAPQLAMVYGVLFDKRQLLDGRPTVRVDISHTPPEIEAEIVVLEAQLVESVPVLPDTAGETANIEDMQQSCQTSET